MIRGRGFIRDMSREWGGAGPARTVFTVTLYEWVVEGGDTLTRLARSGEGVVVTVADGEIRIAATAPPTPEQAPASAPEPAKETSRWTWLEVD